MKKLLATDFDGTWHKAMGTPKQNIEVLEEFQKKHEFGFVTGRNQNFIDNVCRKSHIKYDFILACNGGYRYYKGQEQSYYLEESLILEVYELVKDKVASFSLFSNEVQYELINRKSLIQKLKLGYTRHYRLKETMSKRFETKGIIMLEIQGFDDQDTKELRDMIEERYQTQYTIIGDHYWFDITPKEACKEKALAWLQSVSKHDQEAIYCVGDGENDLVMLKEFNGYRIKKENGCLEGVIEPCVSEVYELMQMMMAKEDE